MSNELGRPSPQIQELREKIFSEVTYYDAFSLALARARNDAFYADPEKWQQTIHRLKTTELDKDKLFDDIHFDVRRSGHPWSPEVSKFLSTLTSSGVFERFLIGDTSIYKMNRQAREDIEQNQSFPLQNYITIINTISSTFDQELGVKVT